MELYTINNLIDVSIPLCYTKEDVFNVCNVAIYRILFIKRGSGSLIINGNSVIFMGPCIFCLNEKDDIKLEHEVNVEVELICFGPDYVNSGLTIDKINQNSGFVGTEVQDFYYLYPFVLRSSTYFGMIDLGPIVEQKLSYLFSNLNKEINKFDNLFWGCQTRAVFIEILLLIQHSYQGSINEESIRLTNISKEIREIVIYIHSNYNNKITIEDLTKRFHMNRTTLSEKFKEATRLSIIDYVTKLRIKIASLLLKETNLPITDIVYQTGFSESNHFGRMFKKYMGCTPTEYRKKLLNK